MDLQRRPMDRKRRRCFLVELLESRRMLAGDITQVNYFDTWDGGVIRSTDVAGIAYHPPSGNLYLADSEINELSSIFNGDNVFETSLSGDQVFREIASGNTEPTGITYNEFDGFFYVTNDTGPKTVTRYDSNLNNPLAVISTKDDVSSATDPEGVTSDPSTGLLYVADGNGGGRQVLVYNSDLQFQYNFSVSNQGDAEGIAFHQPSNHLFLIDGSQDIIFEYTTSGTLLEQYDIRGFSPAPRSPQGLTFGPTSDPNDSPSALSLYIADGMRDNFADGRVYEAVLGATPPGNQPPTTSGIADVNVNVDAPDSVIDLFAAFDDLEDPDAALTYTIENNSNPSLFTSTTINGAQGTLRLNYAAATEGTAVIAIRATDTGTPGLFVETSFAVTVTPFNPNDPVTIEVRVSASSDDAEERPTGGVSLTSSDLELIQDKANQQLVGMRFNGLNIPPGAFIQNAYLQFQVDERGSDPTSLTIHGQAIDNAPTFTSTNGNISGRSTTTASVPWSPAPWTSTGQAGPDQRTPNIAAVVQQIVSRSGWSSGNSLAIIVSGTGKRTAESFNGVPSAAPLLHVEYVTGDPPGNQPPTTSGIANVNLTVGDPNPVIDLFASFDDFEDPDTSLTYSIENNSNPSLVTATNIDGALGTLTLGIASGSSGTANITVRATDTGSPALSVETTFTVTVSPANSGNPITIEVRVAAGSDDAEERPSGSVSLTSSDLELTQDKSNQQIVGMRFAGLSIPPGATIRNAYLQFQADETGSDPTLLTIHGQAIDNAPTFASTNGNISGRSTTTVSVSWSPAPWNTKGQAGPDQQTSNIAAVVQEIVNRPGWSSGNALAIIVSGTGKRTAESFNGVPTAAPLLHVEYDQSPLLVQSDVQPPSGADLLDDSQLAHIVNAGVAQLSQLGNTDAANVLAGLKFEVVDLPGNLLGRALPNTIQIDADAAGFGWFVDTTPYDDVEFIFDSTSNQLVAPSSSQAHARVDLLTTVMHELGHVLGLEHTDSDGLMDAELPLGTRRLAGPLSGLNVDAFYDRFGS